MASRTFSISLGLVAHPWCPSEGKFVDGMDIDGIEEETPMDEGTPEPEDDKARAVRFVNSAHDEPASEKKDSQPDEEHRECELPKPPQAT